MSAQVANDNTSLSTEDILASLAVLLLAGLFILYQTGLFQTDATPKPATSELIKTDSSAIVASEKPLGETSREGVVVMASEPVTIEKRVVETVEIKAEAPVLPTPIMASTAAVAAPVGLTLVDESREPLPVERSIVATQAQTSAGEPATAVPPPALTSAVESEPEVLREIYIERNIDTNQIDFTGKRKPATGLRLMINGEASEVFIADASGVWSYSKALDEGLYRFALQILDVDGSVAVTTPETYYQVLAVKQSSRDQK